jgi:hypothetical protein
LRLRSVEEATIVSDKLIGVDVERRRERIASSVLTLELSERFAILVARQTFTSARRLVAITASLAR